MTHLLRVDDVGIVPPDKRPDANLSYFLDWIHAARVGASPYTFGVIPSMLNGEGLALLAKYSSAGGAEAALHGWDHKDQALVSESEIEAGCDLFRRNKIFCRSYIPPFNRYNQDTIMAWALHCKERPAFFFGGFDGQDHHYGLLPKEIMPGVIHLSAFKPTYDRAPVLCGQIGKYVFASPNFPLVWTLHATWDFPNNHHVGTLLDSLAPHLSRPLDLLTWLKNTRITADGLTAPHFLAYTPILNLVRPFMRVLDFGSRYSCLPSQMALRGCEVTAVDRYEGFEQDQQKVASGLGAVVKAVRWDGKAPCPVEGDFDLITAVWALQHNGFEQEGQTAQLYQQTALTDFLWSRLRTGGKLCIVNKFSPNGLMACLQRTDPLIAPPLWWYEDMAKLLPGCQSPAFRFFSYEHGTAKGDYLGSQHGADAVYVEMRKDYQ